MKYCLSIAGSDSSGGAGIQADLKTFAALGTYGMTCICALTAQNTTGVTGVVNTPVSLVEAQLQAVFDDIPPDAVKTGMLSSEPIVKTVAKFLGSHHKQPIVVDPVMVATTGAVLLEEGAISAYKEDLLPLADVLTPNIPEAEKLSGLSIHSVDDMEQAAKKIGEFGCGAVLVKGGHRVHDALDVLWDGKTMHHFQGKKIDTENTHGTGCTLSSAIAAYLAKGKSLPEAVEAAKKYLTGAIESSAIHKVGHGHGPVDHFWFYGKSWGQMK
jgi:hydroxymethylpyrimidine/phosphomethylpyrimidine kinase